MKKRKKKEKENEDTNEIEDISFRESVSTRVVPSRGRVRGNPIRQADVNWHLTCSRALAVIWICWRSVSPRVYDLIGRLIYVGNYSVARSDARLRVPNELWVLISGKPMKGGSPTADTVDDRSLPTSFGLPRCFSSLCSSSSHVFTCSVFVRLVDFASFVPEVFGETVSIGNAELSRRIASRRTDDPRHPPNPPTPDRAWPVRRLPFGRSPIRRLAERTKY